MKKWKHPKLDIWVTDDGQVLIPYKSREGFRATYGTHCTRGRQVILKGTVHLVHVLIMEAVAGQLLDRSMSVDHVNGDLSDNRVRNLSIATRSALIRNRQLRRYK